MDNIDLIKVLAIAATVYYIYRNTERASNYIGWLLILSFSLPMLGISGMTTVAVIIYSLTIAATIILTLTNRISSTNRILLALLLFSALTNVASQILHLPNYGILYILAIMVIGLYVFFQLQRKTVNILVVASIPMIDSLLTLTDLIY